MNNGGDTIWFYCCPSEGADQQGGVQIQTESWIQRLGELEVKRVQEHHSVRHTIEGQGPFLVLQ